MLAIMKIIIVGRAIRSIIRQFLYPSFFQMDLLSRRISSIDDECSGERRCQNSIPKPIIFNSQCFGIESLGQLVHSSACRME
jgi:hypothetical protein